MKRLLMFLTVILLFVCIAKGFCSNENEFESNGAKIFETYKRIYEVIKINYYEKGFVPLVIKEGEIMFILAARRFIPGYAPMNYAPYFFEYFVYKEKEMTPVCLLIFKNEGS